MSQKNLNVQNKTHKFLLDKLKDKRTLRIYKKFEKNLKVKKSVIVAVSGGSDSLALSFLTKIYSLKKSLDVKFLLFNNETAIASPRTRVHVVELVGASSRGQASTPLGIDKTTSDFLAKVLSNSPVIETIGTLSFLQCKIIFDNS